MIKILNTTAKLNDLKKVKQLCTLLLATIFLLTLSDLAVAKQTDSFEIPDKPSIRFLALETTIIGNKEQPKVISIVPWQTPTQQAVTAKTITNEIQLVFRPIEIESLQKELEYFNREKNKG